MTYRAFEWSLRGVHLSDMTVEMVRPWERNRGNILEQLHKTLLCDCCKHLCENVTMNSFPWVIGTKN